MSHWESGFPNLLSGGFFRVQVGHGWTHGGLLAALPTAEMWRSGFCCFPCSTSLTWACFPITVPPWLYNVFLWQTGWLGLRSLRQRWTDWKDRREGKERGRDGERRERREGKRAGGVERGSPASLCQGFPRSHLGRVNPRLAQAHSWTLTSPPSLSLSLPLSLSLSLSLCLSLSLSMSPQHLPPPSTAVSLPAQTMNKRACLRVAAEKKKKKKVSSAERRGDTSWRRLPTTARSWFFSVQRVRKESRKVAIHLHRIMRSVDEKGAPAAKLLCLVWLRPLTNYLPGVIGTPSKRHPPPTPAGG